MVNRRRHLPPAMTWMHDDYAMTAAAVAIGAPPPGRGETGVERYPRHGWTIGSWHRRKSSSWDKHLAGHRSEHNRLAPASECLSPTLGSWPNARGSSAVLMRIARKRDARCEGLLRIPGDAETEIVAKDRAAEEVAKGGAEGRRKDNIVPGATAQGAVAATPGSAIDLGQIASCLA